ncbi:hypothetical protein PENARI_c033G05915 [Penicillium arizonense]|uniref:Aldehyde dehydrogenase domain-containing protein n=1 Tax=Penicillium arizonense TaxID=1835702 RepID=A0A1F5L465_PENAI|nr:hypothetical protein PENARI_c033G05915 [Penicillium arizonense]OGE48023.1 hypothetical protein PENARI_c033G05915 [Penicillium arizonense]
MENRLPRLKARSSNRVSTVKEPVGVCGLITPWNFPAAMITRKIGPALAAGSFRVGIPKGVVNIVTALEDTPEVGHTLTTHPDIKKISFTGSTRVGKLLMGQAFSTVKRVSWELGGNAPFIVFDDVEDIDTAGRWRSCVEVPRYWTNLRLR